MAFCAQEDHRRLMCLIWTKPAAHLFKGGVGKLSGKQVVWFEPGKWFVQGRAICTAGVRLLGRLSC